MRILSVFCIVSMLMTGNASASETVTLVADRWCPYNCEPDDKRPGFMIELAQRAFARHHITVRYSLMPWTEAIEESRKGNFTGIVGASQGDAPDFIFPDIMQGTMQNRLYVKAGNRWRYKNIKSLRGVTLGVIEDYSYGDALNNYIEKHKNDSKRLHIARGDDALEVNVKKLMSGDIDVLIEDNHVMDYYLSEHRGEAQVGTAGTMPFSTDDDLFIAFSPAHERSKDYAQILADETRNMKRNGELAEIMKKYGIVSW